MIYTNKNNFGKFFIRWNPWFGCFKISEGCVNCFIHNLGSFIDRYFPFNISQRDYPVGQVVTISLNSDFFLKEADKYRNQAWQEIKKNSNLIFLIITKRVDRIKECLPLDWDNGYENVIICATVETQQRADERIPLLLELPLKHRWVTCSPLLEHIDLSKYLSTGQIEHVEAFGEKVFKSTSSARPVAYEWFESLSKQCIEYDVRFSLPYVGNQCIMPDGSIIGDCCTCFHSELADSLDIENYKPITFKLKSCDITY